MRPRAVFLITTTEDLDSSDITDRLADMKNVCNARAVIEDNWESVMCGVNR